MKIELITTGDELVTGQIVDTNSPWLMDRFFTLGESVSRKVAVGDDLEDIVAVLREAAARADLVIVSGGLGPTLDDRTVEAACVAFGRTHELDTVRWEQLHAFFAARGRPLSKNDEKQALVPSGAEVIDNDLGTATPFVLHEGGCELWFLPGVPRELKGLTDRHLFPRLKERLVRQGIHRCYRAVKCHGIAEALMDEAVRPILARHPHVRYGTRTFFPENHVKLLAEGSSREEAERRCDAIEREVREALGPVVWGGAGDTFAGKVLEAVRSRGWKVCFAESLTAGLAASTLAEAPGASEVLLGSFVAYDRSLKEGWLGVPPQLIDAEGVVSEATARAMAEGALKAAGADAAVALTGWAGPGPGSDGQAPGSVWVAFAEVGPAPGESRTFARFRRLPFGRNEVRLGAAYLALDLLRRQALSL